MKGLMSVMYFRKYLRALSGSASINFELLSSKHSVGSLLRPRCSKVKAKFFSTCCVFGPFFPEHSESVSLSTN